MYHELVVVLLACSETRHQEPIEVLYYVCMCVCVCVCVCVGERETERGER